MTTQMMTISVSVPRHLVDQAKEIQDAKKLTRSKLITQCLQEMVDREKEALMIEGYKAMAKENKDFAKMAFELQRQVVLGKE